MTRLAAVSVMWVFLILFAPIAHAEKRVALVIGNDAYQNLPDLQKAVNDARAVAVALDELGFKVIKGENLTRRQTNRYLADLDAAISPGDRVFFFFAGHGVALGAENFLLPSDMPKPRTGEDGLVRDEAHTVSGIVERIQARGAAVSFFVLDACRDNPFKAVGVRSIGGTRGLTWMAAPNGVFILYSAGIGQAALDRLSETDPNPNSVFTRKLVPLLKTPGLTQVALAKRVQEEVNALARTVGHPQQPAYYDQIIGETVLRPGGPADGSQPTEPETGTQDGKKLTQRLLADGSEVHPGAARDKLSVRDGSSVAQAGPVGQRAIFYEERTSSDQETADQGNVVWTKVEEAPGAGEAREPAIRADVSIAGKDLTLRMTIRRNTDKTLPASHIIELVFVTPEGFAGGAVDDVLRVAFKDSEQSAGNPLLGLPVKIGHGLFLYALTDGAAEVETNTTLMRRQPWIDVTILYRTGRRALITMEKGIPGGQVFDEVLQAWSANTKSERVENTSRRPPESPAAGLIPAAQAWEALKDTDSKAVLEAFIKRFGDSVYADFAKARLGELEKSAQNPETIDQNIIKFIDEEYFGGGNPMYRIGASRYAKYVNYYDRGKVSREAVLADKEQYYRRWPTHSANRMINEIVEIQPADEAHVYRIKARFRFLAANSKKTSSGVGTVFLTLKDLGLAFIILAESSRVDSWD